MVLYSIKNTLTNSFNPPFVARDQLDAKETVRKAIISGRDVSLLVELDNLELYEVGEFNASNAMLLPFYGDCLQKVVSLADIPLPEHLNKMIAKMKEVKE